MNDNRPPKGTFQQNMAWLHSWAGLALGSLLFFMFATGSAGYFDTELDRWMMPELPPPQYEAELSKSLPVMLEHLSREAPGAARWLLRMPIDRNQPYAEIAWQGADPDAGASAVSGNFKLNVLNGERLQARDTGGGQHLYRMHWRLHYLSSSISNPLISIASLVMFIALITGIIIHRRIFRDFFTFRPARGQRSWLDAHNLLSVITLPFQVMITYSGLIFLGFSFMPLIVTAHYGNHREGQEQFFDEIFQVQGIPAPSGTSAPLADLSGPLHIAQQRWGERGIRFVDIRHPGDGNARMIFVQSRQASISSTSERLIFDGVSGQLIGTGRPVSAAKQTRDTLIGLHEGLFASPILRWMYFASGLLGSAMIATGLILWTVKRRERNTRLRGTAPLSLRLVEHLNVASVAGLWTALASYFWANRLLPLELPARAQWEANTLFICWLLLFIHAALRAPERAWPEQFLLAGFAWGALPLVNLVSTDQHLINSITKGDWQLAAVDLGMLTLGCLFAGSARYLYRKSRQTAGSRHETLSGSRPALEAAQGARA